MSRSECSDKDLGDGRLSIASSTRRKSMIESVRVSVEWGMVPAGTAGMLENDDEPLDLMRVDRTVRIERGTGLEVGGGFWEDVIGGFDGDSPRETMALVREKK